MGRFEAARALPAVFVALTEGRLDGYGAFTSISLCPAELRIGWRGVQGGRWTDLCIVLLILGRLSR